MTIETSPAWIRENGALHDTARDVDGDDLCVELYDVDGTEVLVYRVGADEWTYTEDPGTDDDVLGEPYDFEKSAAQFVAGDWSAVAIVGKDGGIALRITDYMGRTSWWTQADNADRK